MPTFIEKPTQIPIAGTNPEIISEYAGRVHSQSDTLSVARIQCPPGWIEPAQRPDFDEYTVVLSGLLRVKHAGGTIDVRAGQAIITYCGERVQYSAPTEPGADYIAVCRPAFSLEAAHREPGQ